MNADLIDLYRAVAGADAATREALEALAKAWDEGVARVAEQALAPVAEAFVAAGPGRGGGVPARALAGVEAAARDHLGAALLPGTPPGPLPEALSKAVAARMRRAAKLEVKHATTFDLALARDTAEAGLRGGLYTWVRDRLEPGDRAGEVAAFWFVRELCYGSMFRFNKQGRFNIPYGGIGYNKKRLGARLAELFSPRRTAAMAGHSIENQDFRSFFEAWLPRLGRDDLVFLDPPYDSEFSEYAQHRFGPEDQQALADWVQRLPCQVMLVVKQTPRVLEMYERAAAARARRLDPLELGTYGKTYGYNVRGRNDRGATHLVVRTVRG